MKTDQIICCVVALLLGMLLANMLKNVCGCKVVEGQSAGDAAGAGARARGEGGATVAPIDVCPKEKPIPGFDSNGRPTILKQSVLDQGPGLIFKYAADVWPTQAAGMHQFMVAAEEIGADHSSNPSEEARQIAACQLVWERGEQKKQEDAAAPSASMTAPAPAPECNPHVLESVKNMCGIMKRGDVTKCCDHKPEIEILLGDCAYDFPCQPT
jgi:hypothetical protein